MAKYLYGAAVQGIQRYIFATNKLKEIVLRSDIVDRVGTEAFDEFSGGEESILRAAGNIKHLFESEAECRKAVSQYPKKVMSMAPGIVVSQAVVKIEDGDSYAYKANELESRLRTQRNIPCRSMTLGLMGIHRSPRTGLPEVKSTDVVKFDNVRLDEKCFGFRLESESCADSMTKGGKNSWLAVIHADGNSLGQIVQIVASKGKDAMREFSAGLDGATCKASQMAFSDLSSLHPFLKDKARIPIRPIVLGGDDMTVVCRGDLAMDYVHSYLKHFEEETEKLLGRLDVGISKLSACAGIAFIKDSYPFYYGYNLAEELCSEAKKEAKTRVKNGIVPSCLMFHKVHDSFISGYDDIIKRELQLPDGGSLKYGPYYLDAQNDRWTIDKIQSEMHKLDGETGNAIKADIRQWLNLMQSNPQRAAQKLERAKSVIGKAFPASWFTGYGNDCERHTDYGNNCARYPAYDLLSLHTIMDLETK